MKLELVGIVREIKDWDKDRDGVRLSPDKVVSQITFFDRETGGDVVVNFHAGHGLAVGQDVVIKAQVKPVIRNYKLSLYAQPIVADEKAVLSSDFPAEKNSKK